MTGPLLDNKIHNNLLTTSYFIMKKLILAMSAFAMLFATSCVKDLATENAGETSTVTFSVATPEMATRAYSDGTTATVLQYAVYNAAGEELTDLTVNDATINGSTTVNLELTTGNTYSVIFWAAAPDAPYTVEFAKKTMTVDYTNALSNAENRDAFYKFHTFTVTGPQAETIELKRPFTQLNIGTADYAEAASAGYAPTHSSVTVKNIYSTLNLADGTVENDAAVTFGENVIPSSKVESFPVDGYEYLAMNYVLVAADKALVEVEFTASNENGANAKTRTVGSVPVQRNYRTNIYGNIFTSGVDFNVVIKPEYNEPDCKADELQKAAAFGGEVTLIEDVVLPSALMVQNNMKINLNGHNITITAEYDANNYEASSAIVNNATLVLTGKGEIKATNNYTIRNNSTMTIDGVTVKNGVMNFGDLTVESGNISNDRSGKHAIYGNAAKLTINGGVFHNENAGNAAIFAYAGEVVINGGEFTIADGTATLGWTSCLLDAQGGAKYIINDGIVRGEIRDYGKNTTVYGGVFSHNSVKNFVAPGYKAVLIDGLYHVLSEVVADAATTANVTAFTESTADIATALNTDNGEATMFMWNDVAYIANYGEVVITSAADEATTVRGVVESAAGLTSATVAEGIEVIGNRTFRKCANLNTVKLPDTLTEIGPAVFQSCSKLANVTIPATVTTIGEGAFAECTSLASINIPEGVTRLEKDVLRNTGLTSIEIPASVNYIGTHAFRDCESLTEVKILSPEFTIEGNSFTNISAPVPSMTIYVVNAEMKAYLDSKLSNYDKSYITVVVM